MTTNYTLDLPAGLTQVLTDGTNTYLYGNGRIAQYGAGGAEYFLGDALGSVRQLADANGAVTLARAYEPYGSDLSSEGTGATNYGFVGEWKDETTALQYLRARWYALNDGRFFQKDPLGFDANLYVYAASNPVNLVDPTGLKEIRIWAAAFIQTPFIVFPYFYEPKFWDSTYMGLAVNILPLTFSATALWAGDDRNFYSGGNRPSSRVWHEVVIDTNPLANSSIISNVSETGRTEVFFTCPTCIPWNGLPGFGFATAKAAKPPLAKVTRSPDRCKIEVEIDIYNALDSGSNPLGPEAPQLNLGNLNVPAWQATPPIRYQYRIVFDLGEGRVELEGKHSAFPWHELFIDGLNPNRFPPTGPTYSPLDLYPEMGGDYSFGPLSESLQLDDENTSICSASCK